MNKLDIDLEGKCRNRISLVVFVVISMQRAVRLRAKGKKNDVKVNALNITPAKIERMQFNRSFTAIEFSESNRFSPSIDRFKLYYPDKSSVFANAWWFQLILFAAFIQMLNSFSST